MKYKPKSKAFFLKRIGKRIYRDNIDCCDHCKEVSEKGLIVMNKLHADYLACVDNDYALEGIYCNYRDKK